MAEGKKIKGRISSFQSLGTVDGPGVRSVVFMQGCPLRCVCCHNPETWDLGGGYETDTDSLAEKILRFKPYFGSNGGVTVSGGEPLMQAEFVNDLFVKLKEQGINTALDTSGCLLDRSVDELLRNTDLVLLDYKYTNSEDYIKYTKCRKETVDAFLDRLESMGKKTIIRHVVIHGLNDTYDSFEKLAQLSRRYSCVKEIELLPFRKLCIEKYDELKLRFPLKDVPETENSFIDGIYEKYGDLHPQNTKTDRA